MNQIEQTTQWLDEFAVKVRQFSGDDPELWGEVLEEEATSLFAKLVGKAGVKIGEWLKRPCKHGQMQRWLCLECVAWLSDALLHGQIPEDKAGKPVGETSTPKAKRYGSLDRSKIIGKPVEGE